jgi:hypothetical protein
VVYALFAGAGGAYAENDAPDPGSYPREYRGCSGIRIFCAFGPVPARHQAKDGGAPGKCLVHAICQVRPAAAHANLLLAEEPVMSITARRMAR